MFNIAFKSISVMIRVQLNLGVKLRVRKFAEVYFGENEGRIIIRVNLGFEPTIRKGKRDATLHNHSVKSFLTGSLVLPKWEVSGRVV